MPRWLSVHPLVSAGHDTARLPLYRWCECSPAVLLSSYGVPELRQVACPCADGWGMGGKSARLGIWARLRKNASRFHDDR